MTEDIFTIIQERELFVKKSAAADMEFRAMTTTPQNPSPER